MKISKKWLSLLLSIASAVCLIFGLVACKPSGKNPGGDDTDTLAAPVIALDEATGLITWEAVEGADRYIVYEDGVQVTTVSATQYQIDQTVEGTYEYTVASYNLSKRETSEKSNPVTYTVSEQGGGTHTEHDWEYQDISEDQHLKSCKECLESELEAHSYDDDYDMECNDCGHVRSHQHTFTYELGDDEGHYKTCTTCEDVEHVYEEHVYDNPGDVECNYCGYTRQVNTPDTYATLGVGSVDTSIPATGSSLIVNFGSSVKNDRNYVLELIADSYSAFYTTNIQIKNGDVTVATIENGVSNPEEIVLEDIDLSAGLVITQDGEEAFDVSLILTEQVKKGNYQLQVNSELTIDIGTGSADLSVTYANTVVNGKKYDLTFSSITGGDTDSFQITFAYYEGGSLKTKTFAPDASETITYAADTAHGLRITFTSNGTVQSVSLKLVEHVEAPVITGSTKNNPIIKNTVAGTHSTTELQEAYFRLPAIGFDDKYKITFADTEGVEVKIVNGTNEEAVWSDAVLTRDHLASINGQYNYFFVTAPVGKLCSFTLEVYEEAETYELYADGTVVYAEIGVNANKAAQFNLIDVESGEYTINIGTQSGLTFCVIVGGTTYTLGSNDYKSGVYSKTITIDSETVIGIYVSTGLEGENSIGNVQVSLSEPANTSPLEIGKDYKTVFKAGPYDSNMAFEIALKDVPKDNYLITFTFTSNTSTVFVVTPDKGSAGEVGTSSSYRQAQGKIVIDEGCTKITVSLKDNQAPGFVFHVTILLEVNPEKTPVLKVNDSVKVTLPYSTGSDTVRIDMGNDVKKAPTTYKLSVTVPDDNGSLNVFVYTATNEIGSGGIKLEYNASSGKYETKVFENTTGYILLKHMTQSHPFECEEVTVALSEPGFGIGDYLDTQSTGMQIGTSSSNPFKVTLDGDIEDGTELVLTVTPSSTTNAVLHVSTDGSAQSSTTPSYNIVDGVYTIEFEKSGNVITLRTKAGYFHAMLHLALKGGNPGGGDDEDDEYSSEGVSLAWSQTVNFSNEGSYAFNLRLADANSTGSEIGKSIPAGEYTFKFKLSKTTGYMKMTLTPSGGAPVKFGDYNGVVTEVTVTIPKGCTSLTFQVTESGFYGTSGVKVDMYLLGEGATIGGEEGGGNEGGGGDQTYLFGTATVGGWGSPVEFDVSSLAYGEYRIWIGFSDPIFADTSQPVFVTCNSTQDDDVDLQAFAGWTSGLVINGGTLYIYGFANVGQTISIEIEK